MDKPLAEGDRVTVADLQRGEVWQGVIIDPVPRLNPTHVHVQDDNGLIWRVGVGFVKRVGE